METIMIVIVGLIVAGILWRITKFVAKLVIFAVVAWVIYSWFVGNGTDAPDLVDAQPIVWEQTHQV